MPFFSVIIPTRNRPALFREAISSVLAQSFSDFEAIVVVDGSSPEHCSCYEIALNALEGANIRAFWLVDRPNGHGGAYSHNFGASAARAPYLCFLDDDDCWTDRGHLDRAHAVIVNESVPVDLYMTNQTAFFGDEKRPGPIWLDDLPTILTKLEKRSGCYCAHTITVAELLQSAGFCHVNNMIVRRELYERIGGMDEANRWEYDRDLYLRLIDRGALIKYAPVTVSRHNIPDPTKAVNMTTVLSEFDRLLYQLRVLDRAILLGTHPMIRAHGRRGKGYTLKKMTEALAAAGRYREAAWYAREAFGVAPTAKWAGYTVWRALRAIWN